MDATLSSALERLRARVRPDANFPDYVFSGDDWGSFFLFDPTHIQNPEFADWGLRLAMHRGGKAIDVLSLDRWQWTVGAPEPESFRLEAGSVPSPFPWQVLFLGRFCAGPDDGSWCIYCEGNNEMALLAWPEVVPSPEARAILASLDAMELTRKPWPGDCYGFELPLPPEWRRALVKNYCRPASGW